MTNVIPTPSISHPCSNAQIPGWPPLSLLELDLVWPLPHGIGAGLCDWENTMGVMALDLQDGHDDITPLASCMTDSRRSSHRVRRTLKQPLQRAQMRTTCLPAMWEDLLRNGPQKNLYTHKHTHTYARAHTHTDQLIIYLAIYYTLYIIYNLFSSYYTTMLLPFSLVLQANHPLLWSEV